MQHTGRLVTYSGVGYTEDAIDVASAPAVHSALKRIDGFHTTDLYVDGSDSLVLMVAGGPDRFQVSIWDTERDRGWAARDLSADPEVTVDLVVGGQGADLPLTETLDRPATETAILVFVTSNAPAPDIDWVEG